MEAGDSIDITRRGKPVARLTTAARPRQRIDAALLQALTAALPPQPQDSANLVRAMRDGATVLTLNQRLAEAGPIPGVPTRLLG